MDRDALSWVVDISTVVIGATAVVAIVIGMAAARSERDRHGKTARFQLALDHHARIYAAAAQAIRLVSSFTRRAEARIQARDAVALDAGLDRGATLDELLAAHEEALRGLDELWFLIAADGSGHRLLDDLGIVNHALDAVRPAVGHDAGIGSLDDLFAHCPNRAEIEMVIELDGDLSEAAPMERLRVVRELATKYLRFEIGELVPPPPIAEPTRP